MKDSVGKWYRDKANDLNVIPPHEAWKNVEKTMEDWPKHWYQANFVGIDKDLDATSWESISQQLEIQRNTRRAKRQFVLRSASITAAIALIPLWIANVSDGFVNNVTTPASSQPNVAERALDTETNAIPTVASNNNITNASTTAPSTIGTSEFAQNGSNSNSIVTTFTPEPITAATLNETQNVAQTSDLPVLLAMNPKKSDGVEPFGLQQPSLSVRTVAPFSFALSEVSEDRTAATDVAQNWRIGPTVTFGRTALINPLSYRNDATVSNSPNIAYGLSASRKFNRNIITADFLFNDAKSQNISISSEEVHTRLNFATVSLQYERVLARMKFSDRFQPELTFGLGAFGSYLTDENITSDATNSHFTSFTYKQFDFGGVVSIGASTQLSNHIRFGINGRIQSGAMNLFEGRAKIPSNMFKTHTFVTSLQAKLSYTF